MTLSENIQHYVQRLPVSLQHEVLDFVQYLLYKREREVIHEQDEYDWSSLSLALAMRGIGDEGQPAYTSQDLQEVFS
jgi:hypothetical protein